MTECGFCDPAAVASQVVAEVHNTRLWLPRSLITDAGLMATPIRHVERLVDVQPSEAADLWRALQVAQVVAREIFDAVACNYAMNDGRPAGQSTPHVHMHIWPRTAESGYNPFPALSGSSPYGARIGSDEWTLRFNTWRNGFANTDAGK